MSETALGNDLCALFNGFSGKETAYQKIPNDVAYHFQRMGTEDSVMEGMRVVAEANNLRLRFLEPGDHPSGHYMANRINVQLEEAPPSNKLVIGKMFIG